MDKLTPAELWDIYVGSQSRAEFCSYPGSLHAYVQDIPNIFDDYDPDIDPSLDEIEAGLERYIAQD